MEKFEFFSRVYLSLSLSDQAFVDLVEEHDDVAFFSSERGMALMAASNPHIVNVHLHVLDDFCVLPGLAHDELVVLGGFECDCLARRRL